MDGGGEWDGQWGGMVGETGASRSCGMVVVARNGGRRGLEDEGEQRGKKSGWLVDPLVVNSTMTLPSLRRRAGRPSF